MLCDGDDALLRRNAAERVYLRNRKELCVLVDEIQRIRNGLRCSIVPCYVRNHRCVRSDRVDRALQLCQLRLELLPDLDGERPDVELVAELVGVGERREDVRRRRRELFDELCVARQLRLLEELVDDREAEAGVEDDVVAEHHTYTRPEEVVDFVTKTGCDSLAISIGTSHGAYKFKPEQCHLDPATGRLVPPPLAFDVLDGVMKELPGFPIVLHGSSSVPQDEVDTINKYGGKLKAAVGIPEEQLRKAAKSAVCKINIDSDSRLAMTAAVRKVFAENPAEFDPRKYLGPARENMKKMYIHKIVNVLGSNDKL